MTTIEVARSDRLRPGGSTRGITRNVAFEFPEMVVARSRIAGGVSSDWHHHGDRDLFGFLVSGRLRLEYGSEGSLAADIRPGDFIHIPARLIHRDVNPEKDRAAIVVNILAGEGPSVVNVDGPDG